jgi:putative transposase
MAKEWIDDYNHNRLHTVLNKLSPIEYLEQYNLVANYSDLSCPN